LINGSWSFPRLPDYSTELVPTCKHAANTPRSRRSLSGPLRFTNRRSGPTTPTWRRASTTWRRPTTPKPNTQTPSPFPNLPPAPLPQRALATAKTPPARDPPAGAASLNNLALLYYHQGLKEPVKPLRGYRDYPFEVVKRVRFIKRAQALGFTLKDVVGLLQLD